MEAVQIDEVRSFWDANPLCVRSVPFPPGSPEFYSYYNKLRENNESLEFSYRLHEYPRFRGKKVLDVGSGNGYVLSKYAKEGAEVYGIDLTPTAISLCEKRFELEGLRGSFQVANAEQLPFEDNSFDCVCSMGVLHHTPNTVAAVGEIYRVLKPGGRLIVMFYHRNSAVYRVWLPLRRRATGKSMQQLVNEMDGVGNPKGDVYSRAELRGLLAQFEDVEMFTGQLKRWMLGFPRVARFVPEWLLRMLALRIGWFLYAKGNKPRAAV